MKRIITPDDIKMLGTILSVWAHPDDETYLAAGILTTAKSQRQRVVCVTATHGEAGVVDDTRWPASRMGDIRTKEIKAALDILGVTEHYWMEYHDGMCRDVPIEEAAQKLAVIINDVNPDTILTFGPDGWTGHPDHCQVSRWVTHAVEASGARARIYHIVQTPDAYESYLKQADEKLDIFFNIDQPPLVLPEECEICFALPQEAQAKKYAALKAMPSQTTPLFDNFSESFICEALAMEAFVSAHHDHFKS